MDPLCASSGGPGGDQVGGGPIGEQQMNLRAEERDAVGGSAWVRWGAGRGAEQKRRGPGIGCERGAA